MLSPPSTRAPPSDVSEEDSIDISTLVALGLSVGDIEKLWASAPVDAEQVVHALRVPEDKFCHRLDLPPN